ncbi:uncharacterized protein LOC111898163 [Lactuca sativa]|uniref:uncharacterized protein LOC111898163 n=1 Tax=Lactuca sativa TaxID=4236 RepID=UPI000CD80947|nr:uncharacterized protein LOC111898163 [Lactuca sativa]
MLIPNNNNLNNLNFQNGGNNDYNDGFRNQGFGNKYRRNPNGGFNNENGGYYNEEFYPASKTMEIRKAKQDFSQKPNEEFHEAFERLKELLRSCPIMNFLIGNFEDAWRFLEQLSHGSKTNYSAKKWDTPVSSVASVGLDKNWKSEGQKICVRCGDSGYIVDECMRSQEEINQVHGYGQLQNSPRSFNRNNNQGGNYNNNGN